MATVATRKDELLAFKARVGEEIGLSQPYVISQIEEDAFAALIGDWDPMHNDPAWKFDQQWGGTVVLGFHVLSRAELFLRQVGIPAVTDAETTFLTVGLGRTRFTAPLPVGSECRCSVTLDGVEDRGDHVLIRSTLRNEFGAERPSMVAEHIGALFVERPRFQVLGEGEGVGISEIPPGTPIAEAAVHDGGFYEGVIARAGEWLGHSEWTTVEQRDADAFAILSAGLEPLYNIRSWAQRYSPFGETIVRPLQLLALRSYFMPQVGLPVLSDERMAAFNYGLDSVRWYRPVRPGVRLRDHVLLLNAREKDPGHFLVGTRHIVEAEGEERAVLSADCYSLFAIRR